MTVAGFTTLFKSRENEFTWYSKESLATWVPVARDSVWKEISQPAAPFAALATAKPGQSSSSPRTTVRTPVGFITKTPSIKKGVIKTGALRHPEYQEDFKKAPFAFVFNNASEARDCWAQTERGKPSEYIQTCILYKDADSDEVKVLEKKLRFELRTVPVGYNKLDPFETEAKFPVMEDGKLLVDFLQSNTSLKAQLCPEEVEAYNLTMATNEESIHLLDRGTSVAIIDSGVDAKTLIWVPTNHNNASKAQPYVFKHIVEALEAVTKENIVPESLRNTKVYRGYLKNRKNGKAQEKVLKPSKNHSCHLVGTGAGETFDQPYEQGATVVTDACVNSNTAMDNSLISLLSYVYAQTWQTFF